MRTFLDYDFFRVCPDSAWILASSALLGATQFQASDQVPGWVLRKPHRSGSWGRLKEPRVLSLPGGGLVNPTKGSQGANTAVSEVCETLHVGDPWILCVVFVTTGAELAACRTYSWL